MSGLRGLSTSSDINTDVTADPEGWLKPQWPAPAAVKAICTTRLGGQSQPPFDELNLALHVGDRADHVHLNRTRLQAAIGARPVFLEQVHGVAHAPIALDSQDGLRADASSTTSTHLACTIMVADCLPVLLCDARGQRVAAAHAGWRGLAAGVLEAAVLCFDGPHADSKPYANELIAWLGPCIGPQAFEVGPDVRHAFVRHAPAAASFFSPCGPGKWLADLAGLARQRLHALGLQEIHGNDGSASWCTVGNPSRFFSHRRDGVGGGGTGRLAACVWRID